MPTPVANSEGVAWVGLDGADPRQAVRWQAVGSEKIESCTVEQQPEALQAWGAQLQARFPQGRSAWALEQSRGAVIDALMNYDGLWLYPVAPQGRARYRQAFFTSGAQRDVSDADWLLERVRSPRDRLRAGQPDDTLTRPWRRRVEPRRETVADRPRLTHRLGARLKTSFPQALAWAGELRSLTACEFLSSWPSLEAWQTAGRSTQRKFYRRHRRLPTAELEALLDAIAQAQPLTRDRAWVEASVLMTQTLVEPRRTVIAARARLHQTLEKLFDPPPDQPRFRGLPGAGDAWAPRRAAGFGTDRQRYQSAPEIRPFSGIAPLPEASGKQRGGHGRRACPKFLRPTFHEFAEASRQKALGARAYYAPRRPPGASHPSAIRARAYQGIRIL